VRLRLGWFDESCFCYEAERNHQKPGYFCFHFSIYCFQIAGDGFVFDKSLIKFAQNFLPPLKVIFGGVYIELISKNQTFEDLVDGCELILIIKIQIFLVRLLQVESQIAGILILPVMILSCDLVVSDKIVVLCPFDWCLPFLSLLDPFLDPHFFVP